MTLKGKIDPLKKTRFQAVFAQIESRMMLDGNPAQKGIPIEVPAQRTGRGQNRGHTQSLADPFLLPRTSRASSDYFLQGHDIRVQPYQHRGDPLRVGPAVHSPTFVYIIGNDP
jgi:hypothetical protein